jgi:hypothetical protein
MDRWGGSVSGPKSLIMIRWGAPFPVPSTLFMDTWEFRFRFQKFLSWTDKGSRFRSQASSSWREEEFRFRSQELHHGKMRGSVSKSSRHGQIKGPFPVPRASSWTDEEFRFRSQAIIKDMVRGFRFRSQDISSWRMRVLFASDVNKWVFCRFQNCGQMRNPVSGSGSGSTWYVLFPVPIIQTPCRWEVLFPVSERFILQVSVTPDSHQGHFRENIPISISRTTILDRKESDRSAVPFPVSAISFCIRNFRANILFPVKRT